MTTASYDKVNNYLHEHFGVNPDQPLVMGLIESPHVSEKQEVVRERKLSNGEMTVTVEASLQEAGEINRNKRRYQNQVLRKAIEHPFIKENLTNRTWYGEADHPHTENPKRLMYVDQLRAYGSVDRLFWDGPLLNGQIESMAGNEAGRTYASAVLSGRRTGFSMRGFGPSKVNTETVNGRTEKVLDIVELFIRCYDWVQFPSHTKAYQRKYQENHYANDTSVTESIDDIIEAFVSHDGQIITEDGRAFPIMCEQGNANFNTLVESFVETNEFMKPLVEMGFDIDQVVSIRPNGAMVVRDNELCDGDVHSLLIEPTQYFRENILPEFMTSIGVGKTPRRRDVFNSATERLKQAVLNEDEPQIKRIQRIRGFINRCNSRSEINTAARIMHELTEHGELEKPLHTWIETYGLSELHNRLRILN